tara:strand:+ start:566 stop:1735 length:1170 start_codon:yes stop_codon:yes gene_type:complete
MNADFERWVSLVDYLHDKMDVSMFHAKDLERLENPAMYSVLKECGVEIKDYAHLCVSHRIFLMLNSLARKFSSSFIWRVGQIFKTWGQKQLKSKLCRYLNNLDPDVIFITPYTYIENSGFEALIYIHNWAVKNSRWILCADHGSKIYFEENSSIQVLRNVNMYFASSDEAMRRTEGDEFVHPAMNVGDLKHSTGFVKMLKSHLRDINVGESVAVFLPSDISSNEKHRNFLLKLINKLRIVDSIDAVLVKAHPNSSFSSFFQSLPSDAKIKSLSTEYNSCEVCKKAYMVISHPSSVLLEALSLDTPVYLVKSLEEVKTLHCYLDLELPNMNFDEWLKLENLSDLQFSFNKNTFEKFAHNTSPNGENRELVYQFLLRNCFNKPSCYFGDES